MTELKIPENWGKDTLTEFIDAANQNTYSVSVHYRSWFSALERIDALFDKFSSNLLNRSSFYEPFLFIRAHSSYRGAIRLSTSGQLPEGYSLLRGCLEYALYGFYFSKYPTSIQTWIERDESAAGKKKARNELAFGRMLSELEQSNAETGKVARILYERTIDAGAHPNRKTITLAMGRRETEDSVFFSIAQLNIAHEPLISSLKTSVQVGICTLKIFKLVFRERFDILGISDAIEKLSQTKIDGLHL
ncbi:MAG TPA: hypothetical protein VFQ47_01940 [Nitrososphaera sp.]|nr:hypothetical protein [Nitrososphaera sp.]